MLQLQLSFDQAIFKILDSINCMCGRLKSVPCGRLLPLALLRVGPASDFGIGSQAWNIHLIGFKNVFYSYRMYTWVLASNTEGIGSTRTSEADREKKNISQGLVTLLHIHWVLPTRQLREMPHRVQTSLHRAPILRIKCHDRSADGGCHSSLECFTTIMEFPCLEPRNYFRAYVHDLGAFISPYC